MATTLTSLVSDIRLISGLRDNQLYTDADIASLASDIWQELFDRFVTANQHYRVKEFDFTLVGGQGFNAIDLPADFQLGNGLELNPTVPRPLSVPYLDNWLNRNNLGASVLNIGGGLQCSDRRYCFTDSQLKVFPAERSAGSYRLFYTPQCERFLAPITASFAIINADHASVPAVGVLPGPGSWEFTNGAFNHLIPVDSTVNLNITLAAPNTAFNGAYPINGIGLTSEGYGLPSASVDNLTSVSGITFPIAGTATYTYQPIGTISELPDYVDPWAVYIKVGTALAIREARQEDCTDLERRFQGQKLRVDTLLQNRQEEPTQPPLTSGVTFWDSL